jgi:hypothetical protein
VVEALADAEKANAGAQASLAELGNELARVRARLEAAQGNRTVFELTGSLVLDDQSVSALIQHVSERLAALASTAEAWLTEADEEPEPEITVANAQSLTWTRLYGYSAWTPRWFPIHGGDPLSWLDLCHIYGPVKVVDVAPEDEDEDDD